MAYDPFSAMNPSDSGLLDGLPPAPGYLPPGAARAKRTASSPPPREEYATPAPAEANAEALEESLREVALPEGLMPRLRSMVEELDD